MTRKLIAARLFAIALGFATSSTIHAQTVYYSFSDSFINDDDQFNVYIQVSEGDNFGLATYNVALTGLDATPLDPDTFVWEEAELTTLAELTAPYRLHGFSSGLLAAAIGTNGYSATNSQFNNDFAVYGVGQGNVSVTGVLGDTLTFSDPMLLGTLTIPGAHDIGRAELFRLFDPSAALFTTEGDSIDVAIPARTILLDNRLDVAVVPPLDPIDPPLPNPNSIVIDFNESGSVENGTADYTEAGVTMTVTPHPYDGDLGVYDIVTRGGLDDTPAVYLNKSDGDTAVTFSAGGLPFTLHSIDFGPDYVTVADDYDGVIVTSTGFQGEFQGARLQGNREFFSGPDFTAITSFTLYAASYADTLSFDNLVITIVPEPAAGGMLAAAVIGVAGRRRRR